MLCSNDHTTVSAQSDSLISAIYGVRSSEREMMLIVNAPGYKVWECPYCKKQEKEKEVE